jgi:hypothetical protein
MSNRNSRGGQSGDETVQHYARSQGVSENDPRVQRYAGEPANDQGRSMRESDDDDNSRSARSAMPEWLGGEDQRFIEAVQHYANSQSVELDDERVQKYARGLKSRTGDFGGREQESPVGQRK